MNPLSWPRPWWFGAVAVFMILFGLLTVKEGGSVLFINGAARQAAGQYVAFVLWFNFIAGFAYALAGAGLWMKRRWAAWLALTVFITTALTFVALGLHIYSGGAYEQRTVIAMSLRTLIWVIVAIIAWNQLQRREA